VSAAAGPLLYLRLDELRDGKAPDASGNALDATAGGDPRIVADDTFGSVLLLDGVDDFLALPTAVLPAGEQLSVCLWLWGGDDLPKACSALWAMDAAGVRTVNLHVPWSDGAVYFDHGGSGGGYDRVQKAAAPEEYRGGWAHWAFVREGGGTMRIYRDGVQWASGTGKTRTRTAAVTARLGQADGPFYPGRVAHLRVYDRAVTAEEIARMMEDDRTAQSSFRRTYPFDLYLHDGQDQEVLYITDVPGGKPLQVEIGNASGQAATLFAPADPTPGPRNYHFALRMRPGTLSDTSLQAAQEKLDGTLQSLGWRGSAGLEADGTAALYFLHPAGLTLAAGQTLAFVFPHASADAGGGARGTRVELRFAQLAFGGGAAPVTGRRLAHLNVVNHQGEREIPLHPGFVGNDVVLNDGETASALTLRIANTREDGAIAFTGPGGDAPSRLIVSFDAQAPGQTRDWALAAASQLAVIGVAARAVHGSTTEVWAVDEPDPESITPQWVLTPTADTQLAAGEWMEIALTEVKSGLPSGPATMYVRYQNVPGYWDGQLTAPMEKGRIVQQGANVGIGTVAPQDALHVVGGLRVDSGEIRGTGPITLHPDVDRSGDGYVRFLKADGGEALRMAVDGRVGIGTAAPAESLHTTGNLRVDGGEIRSTSCLSLRPDVDNTGDGFVQFVKPDGTESVRVTKEGRVGIGTGAPAEALHVNGNIRADGGEIRSWTSITLRPDVDNTGDGFVRVVSQGGTELFRVGTDGSVDFLGGKLSPGINFQASGQTSTKSGTWTQNWPASNGLRIQADNGGVLANGADDVLLWRTGQVFVKGKFYAYEKWFRIPHPVLPGRDLVHGCLEGPENAVYYRGTARLEDGRATVHLPDYFEALTRPEGRTVQLTARGREPFALSHDGVADGAFQAFGAKADGEFDWEVRAVRADVAALVTDLPAE
jgi:Concanavalin A-like lectin/glucanases superfamily